MTLAERLYERGRQKGISRGVSEGRMQGRRDVAIRLLKQDASLELIMITTGLSQAEVMDLQPQPVD